MQYTVLFEDLLEPLRDDVLQLERALHDRGRSFDSLDVDLERSCRLRSQGDNRDRQRHADERRPAQNGRSNRSTTRSEPGTALSR